MIKFSAVDFQKKIYLDGFSGKVSTVSPHFETLEQAAIAKMNTKAAAYIVGGAGNQQTILANRQGFEKWRIVPRMLRNVSESDTSVNLLGHQLPSPLLLAPVGVAEMVHKEADLATARAAKATQTPFIFSNQASVPMEAAAAEMGDSLRFFQLYWSKSRDLVTSLVHRAEACGCKAIVLTLDTTMLGWRTKDLEIGHLPFMEGKGIAQYTSDPVFQKLMDESLKEVSDIKPNLTLSAIEGLIKATQNYPVGGFFQKLKSGRPMAAVKLFTSLYTNPALTWADLAFLREITTLPIFLKGILHPDDARQALDHGMNGIVVSNHGGRQVDGSIGSFEALPKVVEAVAGRVPILLDSGIRGGADMFMALAMGARAVCIGRPYIYGLALNGQRGIEAVIKHFMADFELTMRLAGCKSVSEINPDMLVKTK